MDSRNSQVIEELEGQHYDIGLVGLWYGANYGSVITYYALYHILEKMGFSVLLINKVDRDNINIANDEKQHSYIFARKHYPHIAPTLRPEELTMLNKYCDTFLVGSDQVWNYAIANYAADALYVNFADDDKKLISYAASFGHGKSFTPAKDVSRVTKYLQRFDHVSVREDSGVEILRNEFGVEGTQVLDPVFLLEQQEYDEILAEATVTENQPYMLSYILDPTEETREVLLSIAKKKNLKLINMIDGHGDRAKNTEILKLPNIVENLDTPNWLWYIKHAKYLVTDSCHGASFAVKFERPFTCIINEKRGADRMRSLFHVLDLQGRLIQDIKQMNDRPNLLNDVDYRRTRAIIKMEQTRSMNWLQDALAQKKDEPYNISIVSKKECCGCGACYNSCPVDAITMEYDEEGCLYPVINMETCIHCKKCMKACPSLHPVLDNEEKPVCYAAYGDDKIREKSSSGGIFSMVADKILDQGGAVCGAVFNEHCDVLAHEVIYSKEDMPKLRGSKYVQSTTKKTYSEIKRVLEQNKPALYVGCPCQIAGLRTFLGRDYEQLFTMDLLCHGGPSPVAFQKYLREVHGKKEIAYVGFRDKDYYGWSTEMTVKYEDGSIYRKVREEDLFYRSFLPCLSVRPHCQVCNYAKLPRQGDFTLGDFWGVQKYNPDYTDGKGTSILVVNNEKAKKMLAAIKKNLLLLEEVDINYILTHGQPFARPFRNNIKRLRFHRLLQNVSYEKAVTCCERDQYDFGIYGMNADSYGSILNYYAAYRMVSSLGYTVSMVKRPEEIDREITPLKYRLDSFSNKVYPSVQRITMKNMHQLNGSCHGYVAGEQEGYPEFADKNKGVCKMDMREVILMTNRQIFDDVAQLAVRTWPEKYLAYYGAELDADRREQLEEYAHSNGCEVIDLSQDMPVEEWVNGVRKAAGVITDSREMIDLAILYGIPLAVLADRKADAYIANRNLAAHIWDGEKHLKEILTIVDPSQYQQELENSRDSLRREIIGINRRYLRAVNSIPKRAAKKVIRGIQNRIPRGMKEKLAPRLKNSKLYRKIKKSL